MNKEYEYMGWLDAGIVEDDASIEPRDRGVATDAPDSSKTGTKKDGAELDLLAHEMKKDPVKTKILFYITHRPFHDARAVMAEYLDEAKQILESEEGKDAVRSTVRTYFSHHDFWQGRLFRELALTEEEEQKIFNEELDGYFERATPKRRDLEIFLNAATKFNKQNADYPLRIDDKLVTTLRQKLIERNVLDTVYINAIKAVIEVYDEEVARRF